jgi:Replication protein C N-terminal domain
VKVLNRALFAAGILVIRDVAGRAANGSEARYGLDLTPLAQRYAEFEQIARTADRERERIELLRQRAPIAAPGFRQAGAALSRLHALPADWPRQAAEVAGLVAAARRDVWPEDISSIVARLGDRTAQAETGMRRCRKRMYLCTWQRIGKRRSGDVPAETRCL